MRHTDGFIVGSALIRTVEALWDDAALSDGERLDAVRASAALRPERELGAGKEERA